MQVLPDVEFKGQVHATLTCDQTPACGRAVHYIGDSEEHAVGDFILGGWGQVGPLWLCPAHFKELTDGVAGMVDALDGLEVLWDGREEEP